MKITKVEKYGTYYRKLINQNERKREKAIIGTVASLGVSTLLAYLSSKNMINSGITDFYAIATDVIISLATAYSGIWINASASELQDIESRKKDYKKLYHCMTTNDGEMMVEFLKTKYPGLYTAIEQNIKEKMIEGMTK